jgi:hypothetical protein
MNLLRQHTIRFEIFNRLFEFYIMKCIFFFKRIWQLLIFLALGVSVINCGMPICNGTNVNKATCDAAKGSWILGDFVCSKGLQPTEVIYVSSDPDLNHEVYTTASEFEKFKASQGTYYPVELTCGSTTLPDPTNPFGDESYIVGRTPDKCNLSASGGRITETSSYVVVENCKNQYYMDTQNTLDQKFEAAYRVIYIKFVIQDYDPTKNYALYIDEQSTRVFQTRIAYPIEQNRDIKYIEPPVKPNQITPIKGTIQAHLYLKATDLLTEITKTYTVTIKTFTNDINVPNSNVPNLTPSTFELSNRYFRNGVNYQTRVMNITLYGNSGTTFESNISGYSANAETFETTFKNVWTSSYIHLYPNYLPNNYTPPPNLQIGQQPNLVPKNTALPNYLIDASGYGVLLEEDVTEAVNVGKVTDKDVFEYVVKIFSGRLQSYHNHNIINSLSEVNTLKGVIDGTNNQPAYNNTIGLVVINGFKIYDRTLVDKTSTKKLPSGSTITAYQSNINSSIEYGFTYGATDPTIYNPFCVVNRGSVARHITNVSDINGFLIAVAMHEMAHAWYWTGATDRTISDNMQSHAAHVTGVNQKTCLMLSAPLGYTDATAFPFASDRLKYLNDKRASMQFSEGVQDKLANVLAVSY